MSGISYRQYQDSILRLARSIVIKNEAISEVINNNLKLLGLPVDPVNPASWKYYLNLAGEYHPTNTTMSVKSSDTLTDIVFNKTNLAIHRATFREHRYGSLQYTNLTLKYPNQTDLINGILNPADIVEAISSPNGKLLAYDNSLIEEQEDNLIDKLQEWIDAFFLTWYNPQYLVTDDLYLPYFIGSLYWSLPKAIENIRLSNCGTRRAHSYHIREHLKQYGRLDKYIPYLGLKQTLWLYRNIRFILKNTGKQEIMDTLISKIIVPNHIPLVGLSIRKNHEEMPEEIYPEVEAVRKDIAGFGIMAGNEKSAIIDILDKEDYLAKDNPILKFNYDLSINAKGKDSLIGNLPSKVMESTVIDYSNSNIRTLLNLQFYHWVYLSTHNRYHCYIKVDNPRDGSYFTVTVKDALVMTLYCMRELFDYEQPFIPSVYAYTVLRSPLPTFNELRKLADKRLISDAFILQLIDTVEPLTSYSSTEAFYLDTEKLHKAYLRLWELYSSLTHHRARAMGEHLAMAFFMHVKCKIVDTNTTYEDYLDDRQIAIEDFNRYELQSLLLSCVETAIGADLFVSITLAEKQRELLALMSRLTSYPLQYLRNVAYTDFTVLGILATRFGDMTGEIWNRTSFSLGELRIKEAHSYHTALVHLTESDIIPEMVYSADLNAGYDFDPCIWLKEKSYWNHYVFINSTAITIKNIKLSFDESPVTNGILNQYQNSTDPNWP